MRKIRLLTIMSMLFSTFTVAQTRTITGRVADNKGNPVSFATITETNTKNVATADANGNFTIAIKGNSLTISAVNLQEKTITVNGSFTDIILDRSEGQLQEV